MKNLLTTEFFPEEMLTDEPEYSFGSEFKGSYKTIVDSFGFSTVFEVRAGSYQGDSYFLLSDGSRYGILIFGWGSCSGCDALEGCRTPLDVVGLQKRLFDSIRWFDTYADLYYWFVDKDFETEFYYWADGGDEFITKLAEYLNLEDYLPEKLSALNDD